MQFSRLCEFQIKPKIKDPLNHVQDHNVHISSDIWTSRQGDGIMGHEYHYIQKDAQNRTWKLVSNVLSAVQFNERHTGENIKQKFQQSLDSLGISTTKVNNKHKYAILLMINK